MTTEIRILSMDDTRPPADLQTTDPEGWLRAHGYRRQGSETFKFLHPQRKTVVARLVIGLYQHEDGEHAVYHPAIAGLVDTASVVIHMTPDCIERYLNAAATLDEGLVNMLAATGKL
jgi:hypothetical protein